MQELDEALQAFESSDPILLDRLLRWFGSDDLDVRGAVYAYLERIDCAQRITPPISQDQFDNLSLVYLQACLLSDQHSDWAHARYEAAWALASWFRRAIRQDQGAPGLTAFRAWLESTYKSQPTTREALVNGFLEHVISDRRARKFFAKWNEDASLSGALKAAKAWPEGGGTSPLD